MFRTGSKMLKFRFSYRSLLVLVSTCMVSIFVVSLGYQYYYSIEDYISEKITVIEKSNLEQTGNNVDAQLNQIKSITESISNNDDILNYVSNYDDSDFLNRNKLKKSMEILLGKSANINGNILSFAIFTKENVVTQGDLPMYDLNQEDLFFSDEIKELVSTDDRTAAFIMPLKFSRNTKAPYIIEDLFKRYSFGVNLYQNGENIGTLFVILSEDIFEDLLKNSGNKVVFDANKNILYHNTTQSESFLAAMYADYEKNPENALSIRNRDALMIRTSSTGFGVNIGFLLEKKEYLSRINDVKIFYLLFIIALLIISFILLGIVAKAITKPLKNLTSRVKRYNFSQKKAAVNIQSQKVSRFSLRESILVFLVAIVTLSTTVLVGATYFFFSNIIDDFVQETTEDIFDQTVENLNFYFSNAIYASENIIYADSVQEYMKNTVNSTTTDKQLESLLVKALPLYNGRAEISIYNRYGDELVSFINKSSSTALNMKSGGFTNNYIFGKTQKDIDGSYYVPFYMKINNIDNYQTLGYFECRLNELDIEKLYHNLEKDYSEVFIVDQSGIIVSHSNKNMIGIQVDLNNLHNIVGNIKLMFKADLGDTGYTIIETYGENTVEYDKTKFLLSEVYLFVIILLVTFIIAFLLSRNLPSAFKTLNSRINSINFDNLDVELASSSPIDEVNQLSIAFNDMSVRIEHLLNEVILSTKKASELEKVKNQAEITSLQAQINPHFLYNTFENIHWMIRNDSKNEALFMIKCLSSMLRFIAKREPIIVNIGEEIGYTRTYAEIMKTRYEEEIEFEFNIDEKLYEFKIIKLILQPIIENAIEHGVRPKGANGIISITGSLADASTVIFEIRDDGVGMSQEKLNRQNEILSDQSAPDTIGLQNVQARIKLFYGERYGISIVSEVNCGTTVTIRIPAQNL